MKRSSSGVTSYDLVKRVLEVGCRLDLSQEPLGTDDRSEFWLEHLERDLPLVLEVVGEVDCDHATLT